MNGADIERLVRLAIPNPEEFIHQIGVQTFIDYMKELELQQILRLSRHKKLEVVIYALEYEVAKKVFFNCETVIK